MLVATGLTNDEIAGRLVLSPATAKTHVNRAMAKVGARDRAQLSCSPTGPGSSASPEGGSAGDQRSWAARLGGGLDVGRGLDLARAADG